MWRLFIIVMILVASCKQSKETDTDRSNDLSSQVEEVLENSVSWSGVYSDTLSDRKFITDLYRMNEYQTFWFKRKRVIEAGDTLLLLLRNAHLFGLNAHNYRYKELSVLSDDKVEKSNIAELDVFLTDAYIRFLTDIHSGQIDQRSRKVVYKGRSLHYYLRSLLIYTSKKNQVSRPVHSFEPPHFFYRTLKERLFRLNKERNRIYGVRGENSDEQLISSLLAHYKILSEDSPGHFERPDSSATLQDKIAYLKNSFEKEEAFLKMNLEKWRWEKRSYGSDFVFLNIASYNLYYFEHNNVFFSSRVVVGKPENPTPELESTINSVLVYPKWHVPYSIASKEILPLVQENAEYLSRQNMEVLDKEQNIIDPEEIDWNAYNERNLPFAFRQREGEANALGVLKFHFPNKYGVYMHDTNEKRLFKKRHRAYSHGCMRVEKPKEFAGVLLRKSAVTDPEIEKYIARRQHKSLHLDSPVPVFIKYFTAEFVNDTLHIYPDIYKKDKDLLTFYSL